MQHIHVEEPQLRNGTVDGAVGKPPGFLKPSNIIPKLLPGNLFRLFVENVVQVIEIGPDVSTVIFERMAGKTAQGDHFPERVQIIVHKKSP